MKKQKPADSKMQPVALIAAAQKLTEEVTAATEQQRAERAMEQNSRRLKADSTGCTCGESFIDMLCKIHGEPIFPLKQQTEQELTLAEKTGSNTLTGMMCPTCDENKYVYVYDDNRTCYCVTCGTEFDIYDASTEADVDAEEELVGVHISDADTSQGCYLSDDYAEIQKAAEQRIEQNLPGVTAEQITKKFGKKGKQKKQSKQTVNSNWLPNSANTSGTGTIYTKPSCDHYPQHVLNGRGWGVYAGKKVDCIASANQYDVVMNLTGYGIKQRHSIPIPELQKWETSSAKYTEMVMDWPDYGVVTLPFEFWLELTAYLKANSKKLLIFCIGGHGRTGTAVACMFVTALGWDANKAIRWVRKNYCSSAIETIRQEDYIHAIAKQRDTKAAADRAAGATAGN